MPRGFCGRLHRHLPPAARHDPQAWSHAKTSPAACGTLQKMKGISILVDRLYSGYESGKRLAMKRSSAIAL